MNDYVLFQVGEDAYIKFNGLIKCTGYVVGTTETIGLFCVSAAHFESCEYYGDFEFNYITDEDGELRPIAENITADVSTLLDKLDENSLGSLNYHINIGVVIAGYTALKELRFCDVVVEDTVIINWSKGNNLNQGIFKRYNNPDVKSENMYHYHTGKHLYIKSNIERIEEATFINNYDIESITYDKPEKLNYIGDYAFNNCYRLKRFSNNNCIYGYVGSGAFYNCGNITEINLEKDAKLNHYNEFIVWENRIQYDDGKPKPYEIYNWDVDEQRRVKTKITDKSGYLSIYDWDFSKRYIETEDTIELAYRTNKEEDTITVNAYHNSIGYRGEATTATFYELNKPIILKYNGKIYFIDNIEEIYKIFAIGHSKIVTRLDNELVRII